MLNQLGNFLNKSVGSSLSGGSTETYSDVLGKLGMGIQTATQGLSKQTSLSGGEQAGLQALGAGMKALEAVPVVGQFAKMGNIANSLMPDFLAGGNKADQFINKIPGLKVLNFSTGKSKDFGLNQKVQSSGYGGSASEIKNVKDNYAGINQGALTSLFGAKRKANNNVDSVINLQNKIDDTLTSGQLALDSQAGMSQNIANQNQIKKFGGFNPIAVGQKGMEIKTKLEQAKELLKRARYISNPDNNYVNYTRPQANISSHKQGGTIENNSEKSIIPGGSLHAHKNHLKDHDKALSEAVTDKGVAVVTFENGGDIVQHAEIERGEIIFRKEISEKLEELRKDGSDDAIIEAGKLIANEIVNNTIDKSEEYEIKN